MNTKLKFDENTFNIYFFIEKSEGVNFTMLAEFLSFLKAKKAQAPYRFSYVGQNDGLISDLSISENILINFSPDSLTESKEFQFHEFLKQQPNFYLKKLYRQIHRPHDLPERVDRQSKKIAALIRSLIFEGDYIFLERPEEDLNPENILTFALALDFHQRENKKQVFISSKNIELWQKFSNFLVHRTPELQFDIIENSAIQSQESKNTLLKLVA